MFKLNKLVGLLVLTFIFAFSVSAGNDLALTCISPVTVGESVSCTLGFKESQSFYSLKGKLTLPAGVENSPVIFLTESSDFESIYNPTGSVLTISAKGDGKSVTQIGTLKFKANSVGDNLIIKLKVNSINTLNTDIAKIYSSDVEFSSTPFKIQSSGGSSSSSSSSGSGNTATPAPVPPPAPTGFCADPKKVVDKNTVNVKDAAQFCDSSYKLITCGKEKKEGEILSGAVSANKKQYVCDAGKFTECFNNFCPLQKEMGSVAKVLSVQGLNAIGVFDLVSDVSGASDVQGNKAVAGLLSVATPELYFKYNGKLYVVSVSGVDQYLGRATVEVRNVVSGEVKGKAELVLSSKNKLVFEVQQIALNVEGDSAPEAYLGLYGYFKDDASLQLMATVSPVLNLDKFSSGIVFLPSMKSQDFLLNGKHTVLLSTGAAGQVLVLDDVQYTTESGEALLEFGQKVYFEVLGSELLLGVVKLSKTPGTLSTQYERFFTKVIKYDVDGTTSYQICKNDPAVLNVVSVCDGNQKQQFNLDKVKKVEEKNEVLYWYVPVNQSEVKKVQVFQLVDLGAGKVANKKATAFAQNFVSGKRLALKVDGKYFVLSHPVQQYMELPLLQLTSIEDGAVYIGEGNQEEVVFNLPLARQVNIKLNLGVDLGYDISAKTTVSKDINLVNQLQTKISTYGATKLQVPDLGEMGIHSEDIKTLKDKMRVKYTQKFKDKDGKVTSTPNFENELSLNVPTKVVVFEGNYDLLVYYHKFTAGGADKFTKYADIYLLYNLNYGFTQNHEFTDENFVYPLVKGAKIAFLYDKKYYLLGYGEPWDPKGLGFSIEKLQLTSMDGATTYSLQKTPKGVVFEVAGGRKIEVWYDTIQKEIYFKGAKSAIYAENSVDFETEFFVKLPESTLTQKNVLDVSTSEGSGKYYNCDTASTKGFKDMFLLCGLVATDEGKPTPIAFNVPTLVELNNKPAFVVWYKAKTGIVKDVGLHKVVDVSGESVKTVVSDWEGLLESLQGQKNPVLKDGQEFYELTGKSALNSFALKRVPTGQMATIQMESITEGRSNGTIVLGNSILFFQQYLNLDDFNIQLDLYKLPVRLLTSTLWVNVSAAETHGAVVAFSVSGAQYRVVVTKVSEEAKVMRVRVFDEKADFKKEKPIVDVKLAQGATKKLVLQSGKVLRVEMVDVKKGIAAVAQ